MRGYGHAKTLKRDAFAGTLRDDVVATPCSDPGVAFAEGEDLVERPQAAQNVSLELLFFGRHHMLRLEKIFARASSMRMNRMPCSIASLTAMWSCGWSLGNHSGGMLRLVDSRNGSPRSAIA